MVHILTLRFGSLNRAEIYKANLQTWVKRRYESIFELAQSIKKLTRQAYPYAPASVISTLARDHFIDALPDSDVRLRIRETQAKDIAEAEILALRLEAYRVAFRQKTNRYRSSQVNQIGSNECVDTENNSGTMVNTIMDGFCHEFKSLSNDIKQVVKSSQDKPSEKDKNNGYIRPHGDIKIKINHIITIIIEIRITAKILVFKAEVRPMLSRETGCCQTQRPVSDNMDRARPHGYNKCL